MMGNGDDHNLGAAIGEHDTEWETPKDRLSEFPPNGCADSRTFEHCLNCALHIIEKGVPKPWNRRLAKTRRLRSTLPLPREGSDGGSLQTLTRFGHYLITGNRLDFAPKVVRVSTLSFLVPKFLDIRILPRVQLIDELADKRSLLPGWESSNAPREIVEMAAHASIIGAAFHDR